MHTFVNLGRWTVLSGTVALLSSIPCAQAAVPEPQLLPSTVVTAQRLEEDWISLPLSVTAVTVPPGTGDEANIKALADAVPGVYINQFSARALSNPFFRGIGGSPGNPGVTTYIDGVPQLNSYSSNIELLDVERVEFIRGPQGALFGRNTPGGVVNIISARPSPTWTGHAEAAYGNFAYKDLRAGVSGPITGEALSLSLSGGYSERQGYTRNLFNGEDVDFREGLFGKAQLMLNPSETFTARLILVGEQDRDGDYALGDLGELRENPRRVRRDFTDGYNDRDILAPTLILEQSGEVLDIESISGFVYWRNEGLTDLDYGVASPGNFFLNATRLNEEEQNQFTQEFRVASAEERPVRLTEDLNLRWQAGVFLFHRDYEQRTGNSFAPPLAMLSGTARADLTDFGAGTYGQARLEFWEKLELTLGARMDWEEKEAELRSSQSTGRDLDDSFIEATPQAGVGWRFGEQLVYATVAAGYKAGGFNPPPSGGFAAGGTESYDTEHSWNYEIGYKARLFDGKLEGGAALFYVHWDDLQLNQQFPGFAGQYYIGNAGAAVSKGAELQAVARPWEWLDLFGSASALDSEFLGGSTSFNANLGADERVGGNRLPFAPEFTVSGGAEVRWRLRRDLVLFGRCQATAFGKFYYDASNDASQKNYELVDLRAGVRGRHWFLEGWAANAFDEEYIPIAIPYGQLGAPSGYVGESGAPATFGARIGLLF